MKLSRYYITVLVPVRVHYATLSILSLFTNGQRASQRRTAAISFNWKNTMHFRCRHRENTEIFLFTLTQIISTEKGNSHYFCVQSRDFSAFSVPFKRFFENEIWISAGKGSRIFSRNGLLKRYSPWTWHKTGHYYNLPFSTILPVVRYRKMF